VILGVVAYTYNPAIGEAEIGRIIV
jgi:hypothetical protein